MGAGGLVALTVPPGLRLSLADHAKDGGECGGSLESSPSVIEPMPDPVPLHVASLGDPAAASDQPPVPRSADASSWPLVLLLSGPQRAAPAPGNALQDHT